MLEPLLIAAALCSAAADPPDSVEPAWTAVVQSDSLTRSAPDFGAEILHEVHEGRLVEVESCRETWCHLRDGGWVVRGYLRPASEQEQADLLREVFPRDEPSPAEAAAEKPPPQQSEPSDPEPRRLRANARAVQPPPAPARRSPPAVPAAEEPTSPQPPPVPEMSLLDRARTALEDLRNLQRQGESLATLRRRMEDGDEVAAGACRERMRALLPEAQSLASKVDGLTGPRGLSFLALQGALRSGSSQALVCVSCSSTASYACQETARLARTASERIERWERGDPGFGDG